MNNMFEYMTGGQCYKCGGKVRYPDGGEAEPSFDGMQMGQQMQQPQQQTMRAPSTMDANAEQLLQFLTKQLSKGTSERILKKTLTDAGLKVEEATQLIEIAKEEFNKRFEQGDYPDPQEQMMMKQQAQAQQQMANAQMMNPNAQEDASMMNMTENMDQSQTADQEMAQQEARYGGSMKKIRRMNYGGNTCPEGYNWDDTMASCVPSSVTRAAGQAPTMNMAQPQQQQQQSYTPDYNAIMQQDAAQRAAKNNMYDRMMNRYDANRVAGQQQFGQAIGAIANQVQAGKAQGLNTLEALQMAKFGGLKRFVGGGPNIGDCPEGNYWNGTDCVPVFSSNTPKPSNPDLAGSPAGVPVAGLDPSSSPVFGSSASAPLGTHWSNNKQEIQMAQVGAPSYVRDNANNTDEQQYAYNISGDKSALNLGRTPSAPGSDPSAPVDPRINGNPYVVYTDKNKIANIDNNWANRAMAVTNSLGSASSVANMLPNEGFGSGLKFLMGMGAAASGFGLGLQKFTSGDQSRVYDDKGNTFIYEKKRDEKNALSGKSTLTPAQDPNAPNTTVTPPSERTVSGMSPKIGRGQYLQTNVDEDTQTSRGINRKGQLVSYQTQENEVPSMTQQEYDDMKAMSDDPTWEQRMEQDIQAGKVVIKREGGEWNPFVFEQRKLVKIPVPLYPIGGETSPFSFAEWAQQSGYDQDDIKLPNVAQEYQQYVAGFSQGNNNAPANPNPAPTNIGQPNSTNNTTTTNPVQSNSPQTVNTKEYTVQTGDDLGWQVASNIYGGLSNAADVAEGWARKKQQRDLKNRRRQSGNSMDFAAINPVNPYGSMYAPNAGPGANQALATQGYTFDLGTTMSTSKWGGTKKYKQGGVYTLSEADIARIIQMGGEVEFLD